MRKKALSSIDLTVSLHGMNGRLMKMMTYYLEQSCNGIARVVDESESDVEIVDIDLANSKSLLEERLTQQPSKPIVVLSMWDVQKDNIVYVKKPIEIPAVINALNKLKKDFQAFNNTIQKTKNSKKHQIRKVSQVEIRDNSNLGNGVNRSTKPIKESKQVDVASDSFSAHVSELNKLLRELSNPVIKQSHFEKDSNSFLKKNIRKKIRYTFYSIPAQLSKSSLASINKLIIVQIQNTSGDGALIKSEEQLKLEEKVTLTFLSDLDKDFVIPARVVRKEGTGIYGLEFVRYHHKFVDSLFETHQAQFLV